jgi:hypothetical protein
MFFLPENVFNYLLREDAKPQIKKHKETRELNECCPISLNPFSPDSEVATLLCGHCFEPEALNTWLEKQHNSATPMSCPLCRAALKVSKKKAIQTFVKKLLIAEDRAIQEKIYSNLIYEDTKEETDT